MVRYTKRITPDETNEFYQDGDFINFTLPQNMILLPSIEMYYTASVDSVEKYNDNTILKRFLPTNSSAIIDFFQLKKDGEIVQMINEYAFLDQMLKDLDDNEVKNSDGTKSNTIITNVFDNNNHEKREMDFFNTTTTRSYDYCISKWIGCLNGTPYLDCRGKHVQITIKLSPKWITYRGLQIDGLSAVNETYSTDYHYHISKCFMNMTVIDNENITLDNKLYFEDYTHFKSMKNTKSKNTIVRGRTDKNIKYILATFTDSNRNSDTGLQLEHHNKDTTKFGDKIIYLNSTATALNTNINNGIPHYRHYSSDYAKQLHKPNQLNNSIYFKRNGIDVKTNQFIVNSVEVSPPYSQLESFNNVKRYFKTNMNKVCNLTSFVNDFFMNVQEYNNNKDEITSVEWIVHGENRNVGGEAHLFLVHTKSVQF